MTEDRLRSWVRGELSGEDRREVTRWLVRCTDPRIPALLQGMLREQRDEVADRQLSARGPVWTRLTEAWQRLLEAGEAFAAPPEPTLVLASADTDPLRLEEQDGQLRVVGNTDGGALFLTDDTGRSELLAGPGPGPLTAPVPANLGPRPTLWLTAGSEHDLSRATPVHALRLEE